MRVYQTLPALAAVLCVCFSTLPTTAATSPAPGESQYPIPFERNEQWGYRAPAGEVVIAAQFVMVQPFSGGGIAAVVDDSGWVYIDTTGTPVIRPHILDNGPDYFSQGRARFVRDNRYGYFDTTGTVVIEPSFTYAKPFKYGFAAVCAGCILNRSGEHTEVVNGLWGFIDTSGTTVVPLRYEQVRRREGGLEGRRDGVWEELLEESTETPSPIDSVFTRESSESAERSFIAVRGNDSLTWTQSTSKAHRGMLSQRATCGLGWHNTVALADTLLRRLLRDTAEHGFPHSLFLGRLNACPDSVPPPVRRLARAMRKSDNWDSATGAPRERELTDFVVTLANRDAIFSDLEAVCARQGLRIRVSRVEKVLIGTLSEAGLDTRQVGADTARIPFDCQVWLALELIPSDATGQNAPVR